MSNAERALGEVPAGEHDRDSVAGLARGLAVIEAFDERHARLSLTDVAARTAMTRASARRYLLTLTKLGYAEHDGKFFTLTPRILRLGYAYLSSTTLPMRVQPFLERVSEATGESSSAAILDETDVVYVARSATRRIMSIGLGIGSRLPAYCTSLGRALLAHQTPERLDAYFARVELKRLAPKTLVSEPAIRAALESVREKGYALVDEELEPGLMSVAVPIHDNRDRIVCAINLSVQVARMPREEVITRLLPCLVAAGEELRRIV